MTPFHTCLLCAVFLGLTPERWSATEDVKPKPFVTFSVKPEGSVRADAHWMAFTPSGARLVVRYTEPRSSDAVLGLFDSTTGKSVSSTTIKGGGGPENSRTVCAIAPDGGWIAYTDEQNLRFLALPPGKPALPGGGAIEISRAPTAVGASVWLDGKSEKAFLYRSGAIVPTLEQWDLGKKPQSVVLREPQGGTALYAHSLHSGTHRLALSCGPSGTGKPRLESWSFAEKPSKVNVEIKFRASSLAHSPDGSVLAAGFDDGSVAWYDAATLKVLKETQPLGRQFTVATVAFHPGGKHLVCGTLDRGMPNLFFVTILTGQVAAALVADANGVTKVCFDTSGEKVAAFGANGTVTIWDATALLKLQRD